MTASPETNKKGQRLDVSEKPHERKSVKYVYLADFCRQKGSSAWVFPVEVGTRVFPALSVWKIYQKIGVTGTKKKAAIKQLADASERASCSLWFRRGEPSLRLNNSE